MVMMVMEEGEEEEEEEGRLRRLAAPLATVSIPCLPQSVRDDLLHSRGSPPSLCVGPSAREKERGAGGCSLPRHSARQVGLERTTLHCTGRWTLC